MEGWARKKKKKGCPKSVTDALPFARWTPCLPLIGGDEELDAGEEIGHCPSCSLYVIVDYTVAEWDAMKAKMFGASDEGEERKEDDFSKGPKGVPVH